MRITILFGGSNKERLVSVASAQALHHALPEADLWFWNHRDEVIDVLVREVVHAGHAVSDRSVVVVRWEMIVGRCARLGEPDKGEPRTWNLEPGYRFDVLGSSDGAGLSRRRAIRLMLTWRERSVRIYPQILS